jgi:GT2 family glycosyltransferase/glycosyltransferase involved in cell wall biosynthesis
VLFLQQTKYPLINYLHLLGLVFLKTISKLLNLSYLYNRERAKHIKKTGLFDATYYLSQNKDVVESGIDPLLHYVIYGDKEDRKPSLFFDPKFYRNHAKKFKFIEINTLLHYYAVGRYKNISPSQWVDIKYYLLNNRDVKLNRIEPLTHYINYGGFEGRAPNTHFDSQFYLINNPDVKESGINPLIHYVLYGQAEGRKINANSEPDIDNAYHDSLISYRSAISITDIKPAVRNSAPISVDVIIPVYENRILTLKCIASVLQAKSNVSFDLIVINDHSPNEEITQDLSTMAQEGWFTLITNESNKGFVHTVNKGIGIHPNRDIIILNSDTEVYDFWLDRLQEVAYSRPNVASVTPLSNNATICSYPRFLYDNPFPLEVTYAELDNIASIANKDFSVEAPTGIGFCMFMRRAVIAQIGGFDEETFGKGYGEENDWCQRALNNGKINLLATNIFVRHFGNASFKNEKNNRVKQAIFKLSEKYPRYEQDIQNFIKTDEMYLARNRLDWARLERLKGKSNIIIFCHKRGGGTERHIQETANKMTENGKNVYFIRPSPGKPSHVKLKHNQCNELFSIPDIALADYIQLATVIKRLEISEVHVHGLVDFEDGASTHLTYICKKNNIPLYISIHDYTVLCPRINLIDENGLYCGEPDEKDCNKCLSKRGNDFGVKDISIWREKTFNMLRHAQSIVVPNADCKERINQYFPDLKIETQPHHSDFYSKKNYIKSPVQSTKLRIIVIGAIGKMKGFDILLACATIVKEKQLPIEFILMGYSMNDTSLRQQDVVVMGKYDDDQAIQSLLDLKPDVVWLPSIWPETFSYTLSIAIDADLPIFAFDIGAIANRLKALELDQHLMQLSFVHTPNLVIQNFLNYRYIQHE